MVWLLRWHRIKHTKRDDQPESKKKDTLEIKVFFWQVYQVENADLPI